MKEATGELAGTVVVVVSVGILFAFFYFTIAPKLDKNFRSQTACSKAICPSKPDGSGFVICKDKATGEDIKCKYKG